MKPWRLQYLFAEHFDRIFVVLCTAGGAIEAATLCCPTFVLLTQGDYLLCFIPAVVLGAGIGFFLTPIAVIPVLPAIWLFEKLNGAPFQIGDSVIILTRPHRGRTGHVYAVWQDRHQLRVDIGDEERETVTDGFFYTGVCKISDDQVLSG